MKSKRRHITPHEPEQPTADVAEAMRDSQEAMSVWQEKQQRAAKALQVLEDSGMTVLHAPVSDLDRTPRKEATTEQTLSSESRTTGGGGVTEMLGLDRITF